MMQDAKMFYAELLSIGGLALFVALGIQLLTFMLVGDYLTNLGFKEKATCGAWYFIERTTLLVLSICLAVFCLKLALLVFFVAPILPFFFAYWCFKYYQAVLEEAKVVTSQGSGPMGPDSYFEKDLSEVSWERNQRELGAY